MALNGDIGKAWNTHNSEGIHTDSASDTRPDINAHIHTMFGELTRGPKSWLLGALKDEKVPHNPEDPCIIYISDKEDINAVQRVIDDARIALIQEDSTNADKLSRTEIRRLPRNENGDIDIPADQHGLLYLPHPYIVPGVRFNEMYNWDSAFTIRGLLQDGQATQAKDMVDNMLYQIDHYGTILNGNRTYYLDSENGQKPRSQPPLLTSAVLSLYEHYDQLEQPNTDKVTWLKNAAEMAEKYHAHWTTDPHIDTKTGLSMYNSNNVTPGIEVMHSEPEHYVSAFTLLSEMHNRQNDIGNVPIETLPYQDRKDRYYLEQYLTLDEDGAPKGLSDQFYRGDRAMRESGFDPSRLFGFFNVDVINHLPVSLNALRFKMEQELGDIYDQLSKAEPGNPQWSNKKASWSGLAEQTKEQIQTHLFDDGIDSNGVQARYPSFRSLNINTEMLEKHQIEPFRDYNMATSFFPMWAGIATQEQADDIVDNLLPRLMTPYGLMTSDRQTGSQWDAPIMWAPMQVVAMEALERYGYDEEAAQIGHAFLETVIREYKRTGHIHEKYEGITGTANTAQYINNGYSTNDVGFAWTNSAILDIQDMLIRLDAKIAAKSDFTLPDMDVDIDMDMDIDPDFSADEHRL